MAMTSESIERVFQIELSMVGTLPALVRRLQECRWLLTRFNSKACRPFACAEKIYLSYVHVGWRLQIVMSEMAFMLVYFEGFQFVSLLTHVGIPLPRSVVHNDYTGWTFEAQVPNEKLTTSIQRCIAFAREHRRWRGIQEALQTC
jgi:hypothetical protein